MIQFARPPGQATRSSNKVVSFKKFSFFIRSPKGAGRRPPVFSAAVHSGCFFAGNTAGLPIDAEGLFRAISQKRSADHIQMRSALRLCVQLIPIFNLRITFAIVARMDDPVKSGLAAGFLPAAGSSVLPCASLCASLHPVSGQDHTVDPLPEGMIVRAVILTVRDLMKGYDPVLLVQPCFIPGLCFFGHTVSPFMPEAAAASICCTVH